MTVSVGLWLTGTLWLRCAALGAGCRARRGCTHSGAVGGGEKTSGGPHEQRNSGSLEKTSSHRPSGRRGAGSAVVTRLRGTTNSSASCGLSGFNPLQEGFHVGVVEDEGAQQFSQYPSTVFACQLDEFRVLGKFPQHNRLLRTVPP